MAKTEFKKTSTCDKTLWKKDVNPAEGEYDVVRIEMADMEFNGNSYAALLVEMANPRGSFTIPRMDKADVHIYTEDGRDEFPRYSGSFVDRLKECGDDEKAYLQLIKDKQLRVSVRHTGRVCGRQWPLRIDLI